jgi:hypothetical protein
LKLMMRTVPLLVIVLFGGVKFASAQGVSAYFGMGTAMDKSNGQQVDPPLGDIGPRMGGLFGKFGADFMLRPHFGVGGEYSFRFGQGNYAGQEGVSYRPTFYDFNAIWHPVSSKRVVPELQGGLGGADLKFYITGQSCVVTNVCQNQSQYVQSSNHFQLHGSTGVRFYVKGSFYIRPQVDIHWVHNLNEFGSDLVPEYGAVIGYTFGGK